MSRVLSLGSVRITHHLAPKCSVMQSLYRSTAILTTLRRHHVEFINLFGIVLCLCVVLTAALLPVPAELLQELLGAVVQRLDLVGDLTGSQ